MSDDHGTPAQPLPDLFQRWLEQVIGGGLPKETKAVCGSCVMCQPDTWVWDVPDLAFHPDARCCTYRPELWNFQVGAMLADPGSVHPHGLRTVRERIASEGKPIGLVTPGDYRKRYAEALEGGQFGRDASLRCPHFVEEGHACGIWAHRNAVCATWFCRHDRGAVGQGTWVAARELFSAVELTLAFSMVSELLPEGSAESWESWTGTREAFYLATWEAARDLSWADLEPVAPAGLRLAVAGMQKVWSALRRSQLPERLQLRRADVVAVQGQNVLVQGYVTHDPVNMPVVLWKQLLAFDGRPWTEVVEELRSKGIGIGEGAVRLLVDFDVLRGAE
jgi:hypothetical protein